MKTQKIEKAKVNPTKVFHTPKEVLSADIPDKAKIEILKNWEDEARQLQAAQDENMSGGEPSRIDEVRQAIDKLEKQRKAP